MTIAIIDDSTSVRLMIKACLEELLDGDTVLEFSSGLDAFENLPKDSVDLMLCDLYMPGMDGLELLQKLHLEKGEHYDSHIVIITGEEKGGYKSDFKAMGVHHFIKKPIQPSSFQHHVRPLIERIRRRERR